MAEHSGHRKRLWDRYLAQGFKDGFHHDYEKLEFLLTQVIPRKDTKPLAKELLAQFGSFSGVLMASRAALLAVEGVGERTAGFLSLFREVTRTLNEEKLSSGDLLSSPDKVKTFLIREIGWEEAEYFLVLFLDSQNRFIRYERLFRGTHDRSAVFPREVAKEALACNAAGILIAHNHPSGSVSPSREDVGLTKKLAKSLSTLGLKLHDHFVVGKNDVLSLREKGLFG
ncbi:MAG: hypothetical protein CR997_08160 [Acidobacteria bacterium]|nr:MAG: hypothetical protein CR997_08160 [Acidobacteriota bacterium]